MPFFHIFSHSHHLLLIVGQDNFPVVTGILQWLFSPDAGGVLRHEIGDTHGALKPNFMTLDKVIC